LKNAIFDDELRLLYSSANTNLHEALKAIGEAAIPDFKRYSFQILFD
jgi:hypothetical protein